MANETPPFLLLKLRSSDDDAGAIPTWRGLIGGQKPLLVTVTMAYHDRVAALGVGAAVAMDVHGQPRTFTLLSIGPAPDAQESSVVLSSLLAPSESFTHSLDFEAGPELATDIERLHQAFELSCCAQRVLHGTNTDVRFIPN